MEMPGNGSWLLWRRWRPSRCPGPPAERQSEEWDGVTDGAYWGFDCIRAVLKSHLIELILQETRLQTQLGEAVLFHRLDHPVHLSVVWCGEMGEVYMWRNEVLTQDIGVEVSQDLLCIPSEIKGQKNKLHWSSMLVFEKKIEFLSSSQQIQTDSLRNDIRLNKTKQTVRLQV